MEIFLPRPDRVAIQIFDFNGRLIASAVNERRCAGPHVFRWDSRSSAPGCYTVRLRTGQAGFARIIPVTR
jgi:flagellar hook assembly protein FlgD